MKKYLPIIPVVLGILVLIGAFMWVRGRKTADTANLPTNEEEVAEIPFESRPFTSLTPTEDGHWLNLHIDPVKLAGATSLDYELLYTVEDGRTQGVPGTVKISSGEAIERELLLGSESSGKFRYDEGVSEGILTLRLRNSQGKLIGKLSTKFHLQSNTDSLESLDSDFKYILDETPEDVHFVTMQTFGTPSSADGANNNSIVIGIFASSEEEFSGTPQHDGEIKTLEKASPSNIGLFVF
jgi:hypothetical protein